MDTGLELTSMNGNRDDRVAAGNGDGAAHKTSEPSERDGLLHDQVSGGNGEMMMPSDHNVEAQNNQRNAHTSKETVSRIRREMNEVVFWKVRMWMVLIFILVLMVLVIVISLAVCSANYIDEDENFDRSTFNVSRYFNGRFRLPNLVFTEELIPISSNKSRILAVDLQEKITDLYVNSPALGRYFSTAEILAFRNGSVIADYKLKFLMPEEQQDELRNFTLSREVVFNVFRQFLYDQESDSTELMYIDPFSLNML